MASSKAFSAAFPKALVTGHLAGLSKEPTFTAIDGIRNIVAHRLGEHAILWGLFRVR
jgi:hypothetical protein